MAISKRLYKYLAIAAVAMPFALASCSDDNDPDDNRYEEIDLEWRNSGLTFNAEGIWDGWNKDEDLKVGDFVFTHFYENMGIDYVYGFTAAKSTDMQNYPGDMLNHQYTVMPGGGADGKGTPYIVANWAAYQESLDPESPTCMVRLEGGDDVFARAFWPESVKVTNTCYAYYAMAEGDNYARKFEEGDWFKLIATGHKTDGTTKSVEFYLADCKGSDSSKWFVTDWKEFDLSSLGEVLVISFTMESSDYNEYGMKTPAYFALDDLEVKVAK